MARASSVFRRIINGVLATRMPLYSDGGGCLPATILPARVQCAFAVIATVLLLSGIACDEFRTLTDQAPLVRAGSCWSEGESFTEVTDAGGNDHKVEPTVNVGLKAEGVDAWHCGVNRSNAEPDVEVPGDTWTKGFYLPSGKTIRAGAWHNKFWILFPAEWVHE